MTRPSDGMASDGIPSDAGDLLALTAALVDIPSVSRDEARLADEVDAWLGALAPGLERTRIGNTVIARTANGSDRRIVLGGHLDTVPVNENATARIDGDVCRGLGSADMKGGIAVLLRLAAEADARAPECDVTFCCYDGEEIEESANGLRRVFEEDPALVAGDLAVLLEPTDGWIEAGCQGTLHLRAVFRGERAHSARPWMGENAIHRAAVAMARIAAHSTDTVVVDGLEFPEALQIVGVEGGVANNVVPDECALVVNRRFAPAYRVHDAEAQVRELLGDADDIEVLNASPAAPPNLENTLVARAVTTLGGQVRPKLGWTDVARFTAEGIPALNFGPGDPTIAHTRDEFVTRASLEGVHAGLDRLLRTA